jgi:hypothetical protein
LIPSHCEYTRHCEERSDEDRMSFAC